MHPRTAGFVIGIDFVCKRRIGFQTAAFARGQDGNAALGIRTGFHRNGEREPFVCKRLRADDFGIILFFRRAEPGINGVDERAAVF